MDTDLSRRFGGISQLYGENSLACFNNAHVCIIGIGGVGSWAVEALVRSSIGQLTLIDMDHVAESNINRQLPADSTTLGMAKIQVMQQRCQAINPHCRINLIDDFVSADNLSILLHDELDFVIDCIDDFRLKAALINHCRRNKIPLVTTGGAGGKQDPTRIQLTDLTRAEQDPLLSKTRTLLRQRYGFSRNVKHRFRVASVWSDEQQMFLWDDGQLRPNRPKSCHNNNLNCGGLGSSMPMTATFGNVAASYVLKQLLRRANH